MAFDAASSQFDSVGGEGEGSDALNALSQKVWTLVQTTTSIAALTASVGGPEDTAALRQRLAALDATGIKLQEEVEAGLVRMRVVLMNQGVGVHTNQRALRRLEEQFEDAREKFVAAVNAGRVKRRQYTPQDAAAAAAAGGGGGAGGVGGIRRPQRGGVAADGSIVIEMRNFGDADVALAQERQEEALHIAKESAALNRVVRDMHGLVHAQEEAVAEVEANAEKALERVESGVVQLQAAAKYQTAYRWKWACVILGVLIIIIVPITLHFTTKII